MLKMLCPYEISSNNQQSYKIDSVPKLFNKNFFTGTIETQRGLWYLCFDRGWREEGDRIVLKDFPLKAVITN